MVVLASYLGYADKHSKLPYVLEKILAAYIIILVIAVTEIYFLNYTFVGDFGLNRLFMKNALIQNFYFELLQDSRDLTHGYSNVTYHVGAYYFNNPLNNANTNGLLTSLAGKGIAIFLFELAALTLIMFIADLSFRDDRNKLWLLVTCLFSFLLVEQKLSVVLVSSGMLVPIGMLMLMSKRNKGIYK